MTSKQNVSRPAWWPTNEQKERADKACAEAEADDIRADASEVAPYPEHEKLSAISDESQLIGEFLDVGLPEMGLSLYEERPYDCECSACEDGLGEHSRWHSEEEKETIVNGRVQLRKMFPTNRTIQQILAAYFDIDQAKIDAEKDAMLAAIREQSR